MPLGLDPAQLSGLVHNPHAPVKGAMNGVDFAARIAIPDYGQNLERHYGRTLNQLDQAFEFRHFGVIFEFGAAVELRVHDGARHLDEGLRTLLARFGPLLLRNARLPEQDRVAGQRNVFPSLSFHLDRGRTQDDSYSLFWRDPLDPVQRMPRSSSTLILANVAAYLQAVAEGHGEHEPKTQYRLFEAAEPDDLIGKIVFEAPWCAPAGVGEIALLDNRTVLHASHYARPEHKGYPISVRYLF